MTGYHSHPGYLRGNRPEPFLFFFQVVYIVSSYVTGYLDPMRRQQPYEPSWPGFPRSPASIPRSTAGAIAP